MNKDAIRQWMNLLSVLIALTINVLANALPINGQSTGEISDRFQVYFVPAGYVFAIWFVIFVGWIAFAVFQLLPAQKESPRLQRLGYWFALSGILNGTWLFCWHYNLFAISVLVMLALLVSLITCYLKLDIGRAQVGTVERWAVDIPFGTYLGWISVATIANITSWLDSIAWNGFGISPQAWAVIMLVVACLVGVGIAVRRREIAFLLVLVWAFAGIAQKQIATPLVANSAWFATAFVLVLAIFKTWSNRRDALIQT